MPNFQLPRGLPSRMPRLTTPRTAGPQDVVKAAAATEMDVVRALIKEPASVLGITLPDIPGPASVLQQLIPGAGGGNGGGNGGGGNAGSPTQPAANGKIPFVYE